VYSFLLFKLNFTVKLRIVSTELENSVSHWGYSNSI